MLWEFYDSYWTSYHKVTFDGTNRLIYIAPSVSEIDIEIHVYSDWKEWMAIADNSKYLQAIRSVGGDPLPSGDKLGSTFFLMNGWKIVVDHPITFTGNLYAQDGSSPFVVQLGQQLSTTTVSNLIDKISPSADIVTDIVEETLTTVDLPSAEENASAVWDKDVVSHQLPGSFGQFVSKKILTIKAYLGLK